MEICTAVILCLDKFPGSLLLGKDSSFFLRSFQRDIVSCSQFLLNIWCLFTCSVCSLTTVYVARVCPLPLSFSVGSSLAVAGISRILWLLKLHHSRNVVYQVRCLLVHKQALTLRWIKSSLFQSQIPVTIAQEHIFYVTPNIMFLVEAVSWSFMVLQNKGSHKSRQV